MLFCTCQFFVFLICLAITCSLKCMVTFIRHFGCHSLLPQAMDFEHPLAITGFSCANGFSGQSFLLEIGWEMQMNSWRGVLRRVDQLSLKMQFGQGWQELDTLRISMLFRLLFRPLPVGLKPNPLFWTAVLERSLIQITRMTTLHGDQRAAEATEQLWFVLRDRFLDTNGELVLMRVYSYSQTHFP